MIEALLTIVVLFLTRTLSQVPLPEDLNVENESQIQFQELQRQIQRIQSQLQEVQYQNREPHAINYINAPLMNLMIMTIFFIPFILYYAFVVVNYLLI